MTSHLEKFLKSLDSKTRDRIQALILGLRSGNVHPKGSKKLKGWKGDFYRVRMGKIRVIYHVQQNGFFEIWDVDFRGNIY